ncbi:MAG: helix-turn-helix domain-containing protein [Dongiaceae bacterium]
MQIDWTTVDALAEEELEARIEADPDTVPDLTLGKLQHDLRHAPERVLHPSGVHAMPFAKRLRHAVGMSQSAFAEAYGIPLRTLQGWEQGIRAPDEAAISYLRAIAFASGPIRDALAMPRGEPPAAMAD